MRFAHAFGVGLSLLVIVERSAAQSQPETIPIVVAQAMAFEPEMLGTPRYFDGRPPTNWPAALIPAGVKILGGGVVGDSVMFRMQTVVFWFSAQSKPKEVLRAMLTQAGYALRAWEAPHARGGFVESQPTTLPQTYCKGMTSATFGAVDSVKAPSAIALYLTDGEPGRHECGPQSDPMSAGRPPVTLPELSPPKGATSEGNSASWGGSGGSTESHLQTTMPADSILAHYTAQLVGAGWKSEGRPAVVDGVGVQPFSFREGQEDWKGALIVMAAGDRREVRLQYTRARPD